MEVFALGLNHKTTPLALRERLSFAEHDLPGALAELRELPGVGEGLVLSTCNRVEIYAGAKPGEGPELVSEVVDWLIDHFEFGPHERDAIKLYRLQSEQAVRHLFRVVSGLDSMVLGETEIFGQVKRAYQLAQEAGATGTALNRLFQRAFRVGKAIRSESRIQHGATSVGAVAVELAARMFGDLARCRVMVLGAGEQSRITAQSLVSRGARQLFVSNRSFDKAEKLAADMGGRAVRFDAWEQEIGNIDIVISSTSAPHYVLHPWHVERAAKQRRGRPLFLIDIAVPRDVDPAVNRMEGVYLYDLESLEAVAAQGRRERAAQMGHCEAMIERMVHEYLTEEAERARRLGLPRQTDKAGSMTGPASTDGKATAPGAVLLPAAGTVGGGTDGRGNEVLNPS